MKITHYGYNAFLIESGATKIAIDPGQHCALFDLHSLIPEAEWPTVTHLVITHGDPDHHWQSDRVAAASGAHVICGTALTKTENGKTLLVAPRGKELTSWVEFDRVTALDVGESAVLDGIGFRALKAVHGVMKIPLLVMTLDRKPGPGERVGLGATGFEITLDGQRLVNLGDSLLQPEWAGLAPDVLMVPIGGIVSMDVPAAVEAVRLIAPKRVIPCHYNVPFLLKKRYASADDALFKRDTEQLGVDCTILRPGEALELGAGA
ncbi:MAG: MBL fold metallo-hydrolase [Gammaproteobacteria bacterium]